MVMRVAVLVGIGNLFGRRDAAVERSAADVLELDGGVADLEVLARSRL